MILICHLLRNVDIEGVGDPHEKLQIPTKDQDDLELQELLMCSRSFKMLMDKLSECSHNVLATNDAPIHYSALPPDNGMSVLLERV